jgi:hypothetical protein
MQPRAATTTYTFQVAGFYRVTGSVSWAQNSSGGRLAVLAKSSNTVSGSKAELPGGSTTMTVSTPTVIVSANVGDYIELQGAQTSGGSLATTVSDPIQSSMVIEFLSFQ